MLDVDDVVRSTGFGASDGPLVFGVRARLVEIGERTKYNKTDGNLYHVRMYDNKGNVNGPASWYNEAALTRPAATDPGASAGGGSASAATGEPPKPKSARFKMMVEMIQKRQEARQGGRCIFDMANKSHNIVPEGDIDTQYEVAMRETDINSQSTIRLSPGISQGKSEVTVVISRPHAVHRYDKILGANYFVGFVSSDYSAWSDGLAGLESQGKAIGLEDDNTDGANRMAFPEGDTVDGKGHAFRAGDRMTLEVDFDQDTLTIFRNRRWQHMVSDRGSVVVRKGIPWSGPVYFAVSLFNGDSTAKVVYDTAAPEAVAVPSIKDDFKARLAASKRKADATPVAANAAKKAAVEGASVAAEATKKAAVVEASEAEANTKDQSSGMFASIVSGITAVSGFLGGGGGSGGATKPKAPAPSQVSQTASASIQGAREFPCCLTSAVTFLNTQKGGGRGKTRPCQRAYLTVNMLTSL